MIVAVYCRARIGIWEEKKRLKKERRNGERLIRKMEKKDKGKRKDEEM
jgi:hypothetical protein